MPPHSSTMRRVTGLNFDFSSPSVSSSLLLTSPSIDDLPLVRLLRRFRNLTVVADEEFVVRRGVVVELAFGRLRHQRLVAEQHELVALAGEFQILRPFRRRRRGGLFLRESARASIHRACCWQTGSRRRPPRPWRPVRRRPETRAGSPRLRARIPPHRRVPDRPHTIPPSTARSWTFGSPCNGGIDMPRLLVVCGIAVPHMQ